MFLDQAGNVDRTGEQLYLHRTSVYYRLRSFERSTGLDLDDGETRLMLHLWFRLYGRETRAASHKLQKGVVA